MSQVLTSTSRQKDTIVIHRPMKPIKFEQSRDMDALRPGRPAGDHFHHDERMSSMDRNQGASDQNSRPNPESQQAPLKINTNTSPNTSGTKAAIYGEDQVCVCTPAQHVPRPSNSFILYRTRKAQETIAANPGASNPQISKILGEQWANESAEVKAQWKQLAIEESKRHREQYPDYRFQPKRRGSKSQPPNHNDDSVRCPRCNGLRINMSALSASTAGKSNDGEASSPQVYSTEEGKRPRTGSFSDYSQIPRGFVPGVQDARGPRSLSPEPKRRRLADAADSRGISSIQVWQGERHSTGYPVHAGPSPVGHDGHGRIYTHVSTPLPQPGSARPQHSGMPPPPRPPTNGSWNSGGYQFTGRPGTHTDTVRLPPLKTAITPQVSPAQSADSSYDYTPITAGLGISGTRNSPEKSAREQIMSQPFTRKMAVVGKICPPLSHSGTEPRGAIIAIEGTRDHLLKQASEAVERSLRVCQNTALKSWENESKFGKITEEGSPIEIRELIPAVLEDMLSWHRKSKEVISYVVNNNDTSPEDVRARPASAGGKTPVALIKDGYNLTMPDKFACATSNALDNYSPLDHWQWMATLWRGIAGPDLIVYIKSCSEEDMEKLKTVEFQKNLGVMVVRVPQDKNLDEATERRLNFEVIEWITDVWPKKAARS